MLSQACEEIEVGPKPELNEGDMLHDRPVSKALNTQIAQVVTVASIQREVHCLPSLDLILNQAQDYRPRHHVPDRQSIADLKEGNMVHDRPVSKALVTQVAQIVSVAPHLFLQLGIAHRRADHILVHCMGMLLQLARKVTQMVMHLHEHTSAFTSLPATQKSEEELRQHCAKVCNCRHKLGLVQMRCDEFGIALSLWQVPFWAGPSLFAHQSQEGTACPSCKM